MVGSSRVFEGEKKSKLHLEPQGQPFINGCFNWMIPNLYIGNGCFTKHLFINGCLGFQASDVEFLLLDETTGKKVGKRWEKDQI